MGAQFSWLCFDEQNMYRFAFNTQSNMLGKSQSLVKLCIRIAKCNPNSESAPNCGPDQRTWGPLHASSILFEIAYQNYKLQPRFSEACSLFKQWVQKKNGPKTATVFRPRNRSQKCEGRQSAFTFLAPILCPPGGRFFVTPPCCSALVPSGGFRKAPKGSRRLPEAPGGSQKCPEIARRFPKAPRSSRRLPKVPKGSQKALGGSWGLPETPGGSRKIPKSLRTLLEALGSSQMFQRHPKAPGGSRRFPEAPGSSRRLPEGSRKLLKAPGSSRRLPEILGGSQKAPIGSPEVPWLEPSCGLPGKPGFLGPGAPPPAASWWFLDGAFPGAFWKGLLGKIAWGPSIFFRNNFETQKKLRPFFGPHHN